MSIEIFELEDMEIARSRFNVLSAGGRRVTDLLAAEWLEPLVERERNRGPRLTAFWHAGDLA